MAPFGQVQLPCPDAEVPLANQAALQYELEEFGRDLFRTTEVAMRTGPSRVLLRTAARLRRAYM